MASLPMLSDALRRRFEREEKRQANMRRVFGYRYKDGSLSDNLLVYAYLDIGVCKTYFSKLFMMGELKPELLDYDFVYLGVWYKDKRKFDFLDVPEVLFSFNDFISKETAK